MATRLIYDKNYRLGINVAAPSVAAVEIVPGAIGDVGIKVVAKTGQTGRLQEWVGETPASETVYVDKDGVFAFVAAQFGTPVDVTLAANSAGSAATISRSDHKHDLAENIAPVWTGVHTFTPAGGTSTPIVITSNVAVPAITVATSTAVCTNLNADLLDGYHAVNIMTNKTGWNTTVQSEVTLTLATRTVTVDKVGASFTYWIQGTAYTKTTAQTVTFADTEGLWFIYFSGATLTASQTPWAIRDNDKAFVATIYWDADAKVAVQFLWEFHTWSMEPMAHDYAHSTFGTRWSSGLAVSIATANLSVTNGVLFDDDIRCAITDGTSGLFVQDISPAASLPIVYRKTSAAGEWRKLAASAVPVYLATNVPQVNTYAAGSWGWAAVGTNNYFAYWVLATTDMVAPVFLVPGQVASTSTLQQARDANTIESMSFGVLPVPEHKVLARVIMQRSGSTPYYSIVEIADYRNATDSPSSTSPVLGDHGLLTGLGDDDHTQYLLVDGTRAMTGKFRKAGVALTSGATVAVNAALGNRFTLTLTDVANVIQPPTGEPASDAEEQTIIIRIKQPDASAYASSFDTTSAGGFRFGSDVTAYTTPAAGTTTYVGCVYNYADDKWDIVAIANGY